MKRMRYRVGTRVRGSRRRLRKTYYGSVRRGTKAPHPDCVLPKHLYNTNDTPTEEEATIIRAYIERLKVYIRSLGGHVEGDEEKKAAEEDKPDKERSNSVEFRIMKARRLLRQHQGIVSPLRVLPLEILQQIMHFALPSGVYEMYKRFKTYSVPVIFSHVCVRWRNAALVHPALWTTLPQINLEKGFTLSSGYLTWLGGVLKLSGTAPLAVRISGQKYDKPRHPALDLLLEHVGRWRTVHFGMSYPTFTSLGEFQGRFETLEEAEIFVRRSSAIDPKEDQELSLLLDAPKLKRINNNSISVRARVGSTSPVQYYRTNLDWDVLTRDLPSISSTLQSLIIIHHSSYSSTADLSFQEVRFTLPCLKELVVNCCCWWSPYGQGILDALVVPSLERIKLMNCPQGFIKTLTNLLRRSRTARSTLGGTSATTLESLSLYLNDESDAPPAPGTSSDLSELFREIPKLRKLEIGSAPVWDLRSLVVGEADYRLQAIGIARSPSNGVAGTEASGAVASATLSTHPNGNLIQPLLPNLTSLSIFDTRSGTSNISEEQVTLFNALAHSRCALSNTGPDSELLPGDVRRVEKFEVLWMDNFSPRYGAFKQRSLLERWKFKKLATSVSDDTADTNSLRKVEDGAEDGKEEASEAREGDKSQAVDPNRRSVEVICKLHEIKTGFRNLIPEARRFDSGYVIATAKRSAKARVQAYVEEAAALEVSGRELMVSSPTPYLLTC